ncbi:MAG: DUF4393 domain-containing protein [Candidatus Muirbacterium halophilum]|nr:DUF4393 domain-containing protein [Candidatus Muirbacterium halophilum]MCK9477337.1 DUF4393 domain-containing protein [Candidatus Muirbacterium halophilum]
MDNDIREISKAVEAAANFGSSGLEKAEKLGSFFAKVFKEPIQEVAGIIHDKLKYIRWKNILKISDDVEKILKERKVENTKAIPLKLALPLIDNASLEEDQNLQNLWSNLIANAMDPNFENEIRYGFIDMIKNITPIEAFLLNNFYFILKRENKLFDLSKVNEYSLSKEQFIKILNISIDNYILAANNLMRLQLIGPAILTGGVRMGNEPITIYKGTDRITLTPLGVKFIEACIN